MPKDAIVIGDLVPVVKGVMPIFDNERSAHKAAEKRFAFRPTAIEYERLVMGEQTKPEESEKPKYGPSILLALSRRFRAAPIHSEAADVMPPTPVKETCFPPVPQPQKRMGYPQGIEPCHRGSYLRTVALVDEIPLPDEVQADEPVTVEARQAG